MADRCTCMLFRSSSLIGRLRPFPLVNFPACNEQGRGGPIASNSVLYGIGRGLPNDEGADFIDVDVVD